MTPSSRTRLATNEGSPFSTRLDLHPKHGPHNPAASTPPRRPASIRRTTTHDSLRPDGLLGEVTVAASGRDLITDRGDATTVISTATVRVRVEFVPDRKILSISSDPPAPELDLLVGVTASSGFRQAVVDAVPGVRDDHLLRFQLLDDLPTALLVSGYAIGAGGARVVRSPQVKGLQHPDLCAGWAVGGTILNEMAVLGSAPVVTGPVAPALLRDDDPLAWHDVGPLPAHGMRRRRRLDLWRDSAELRLECFFRDSHFDATGLETVIHEYTIHATVDPDSMRFTSCEADVGALPWVECPAAAASAHRLTGAPAEGLRTWVRETFVGPTTCTHLNDTLRSLEDVPTLAGFLPQP
jgi:hypothetical protein